MIYDLIGCLEVLFYFPEAVHRSRCALQGFVCAKPSHFYDSMTATETSSGGKKMAWNQEMFDAG